MKVLGLIPARGGSVRVPRKNLADLGGKPLIAWTIQEAVKAKSLTTVALSTEDDEIALCASRWACRVIKRPFHLAGDDTPMLPVVHDALKDISSSDIVVLLQPTSPFRTADDIDKAVSLFKERNADAVISVTETQGDLVFEVGHAGRMRAAENTVVPNGAIYIISVDALHRGHNWYSGITYAYVMPSSRSLDIDTKQDLIMARAIVGENEAA